MKREQISIQLYCFREFIKTPEQLVSTLEKLYQTGYRSVQLTTALPEELSAERLLDILDQTGMTAISSHERSDMIFDSPNEVISKLKTLNIRHTAYPWPHIVPSTYDEAVVFAGKLNRLAGLFKENGITLSYHNHAKEFLKFGGKLLLDIIYDNAPLLDAEIDTFWVHKGGQSVTDRLRSLSGRMEYLHIKDYGIRYSAETGDVPCMMPVGSGNLNWQDIIQTAKSAGVKYFIVEHDADVTDPFESFEASLRYLEENFMEQ